MKFRAPRDACYIRVFGPTETVLAKVNAGRKGIVVLMLARLHPLNPKTVVAFYRRPTA